MEAGMALSLVSDPAMESWQYSLRYKITGRYVPGRRNRKNISYRAPAVCYTEA